MKKPSFLMYGTCELIVTALFSAELWLVPGETGPIVSTLAVVLLAISVVSTFWGAFNISSGRRYSIGSSIRFSILSAICVLIQATKFLSGETSWVLIAAFSSAAILGFAVLRRLGRQNCIVEKLRAGGKLDIQKKRFKLDIRENALSKKDIRLMNILSGIVILGVFSGRFIAALSPEIKTLGTRFIFLGLAAGVAFVSSYPIGSAIILRRLEREHGITLRTEYGRRN